MKKWILIVWVLLLLAGVAIAQSEAPPAERITYGKLTVYSDVIGADIYVDAKFVGQDRATISNIPTGKHYVRVVKGEETIQSGIVTVNEGEETIIVAKPKGDKLLQSMRKPNYVFFFGGFTDLDYKETNRYGTFRFNHKPQYGFGAEVEFPIPLVDLRVDIGFFQNYPSGLVVSSTDEAQMAISTPYLNLSKNLFRAGLYKINAGVGINYGIFSPGFKTVISIASRMGYQGFVEMVRSSGENQVLVVRIGHVTYDGESAIPGEVTSAGYYLQGGMAYQL